METGWLTLLARFTRAVNRAFIFVSGALAVAIMVIVLQDVVRRYVFNDPSVWVLDVASFMLVYLFFLALAPALQSGSHVTVDLFNEILPVRLRRRITLTGHILVVVFGAVFFWHLLDAAWQAFADNELFPTATPVRVKYVWMIGPIGAAQFILTQVVILATSLKTPGPDQAGAAPPAHRPGV